LPKVFVYHDGTGISKWRQLGPYKALKSKGVDVSILPDKASVITWSGVDGPSNVPTIPSHMDIAKQNDVIVTSYRANEGEAFRLYVQSMYAHVVVDIDDDIWAIDKNNPAYESWNRFKPGEDVFKPLEEGADIDTVKHNCNQIGAVIIDNPDGTEGIYQPKRNNAEIAEDGLRLASLVTTSTEPLRKKLLAYNSNVVVIPNAINFSEWPENKVVGDGLIRIGLIGANSHYGDWKTIVEPIKEILAEFPDVRLVYNSWYMKYKDATEKGGWKTIMRFPDFFADNGLIDHPQVEKFTGVDVEYYNEWLADKGIDIGLAPLQMHEFNRSKSNLKYIEYAALKVPLIAQDFEPYNQDIKHGVNGMLASNHKEWVSAMRKLIKDEEARKLMGFAAYHHVKNNYSQEVVADKLKDAICALGIKQEVAA